MFSQISDVAAGDNVKATRILDRDSPRAAMRGKLGDYAARRRVGAADVFPVDPRRRVASWLASGGVIVRGGGYAVLISNVPKRAGVTDTRGGRFLILCTPVLRIGKSTFETGRHGPF